MAVALMPPPLDTAAAVAARAGQRLRDGALDLPFPAAGDTRRRFDALAEIAAEDLSLARLCEGHTDAIAILAEAQASAARGLYGVWAADAPDDRVTAQRRAGGWILRGRKRYASGAAHLARALVTAHADDGIRLFDVDLAAPGAHPIADTWHAVGMAATGSLDIAFDDAPGTPVGAPGFYLARRGFWHGAIGVAACWYGGALGAMRMLRAHLSRATPTEHQRAHLGAIAATCEVMRQTLHAAADDIDASSPTDPDGRRRALIARHVVEQGCQDVLARTGRAGGTTPLVFDHAHARRAADLVVYLRQHHAERDLAELGALVLGGDA